MIIATGIVRFGSGEIERLKDAMRKNIEATRAEPGCLHYSYAVDLADPQLLHVTEHWQDEASMDAHMEAPHLHDLMAELENARLETISIKAWRAEYLKTLLG